MSSEPPERNRRPKPVGQLPIWPAWILPLALLLAPTLAFGQDDGVRLAWTPELGWIAGIGFFLCIGLNAAFVGACTAFELLRSTHVKHEKEERKARQLGSVLGQRDRLIAACNLGSTTVRAWLILLCFLPAPGLAWALQGIGWPQGFFGYFLAAILLSIPVAAVNLVFGELVARNYAAAHPSTVARRLTGFVRLAATFFAPLGAILAKVAGLFTRRLGIPVGFVLTPAEEEILIIAESAQESGEMHLEDRKLLRSVFEFGDTVAREVMTPRVDMYAVPVQTGVREVIALVEETGHSRIPVYEATDDQIVGIVHAKDLLKAHLAGKEDVREILRPAFFVPENKNLHDLLREMRAQRAQMAIVQDEFGGTAGIVTVEDIVEELVGEIVDEYDVEQPPIVKNGVGYVVGGRVNLYDLNNEIGSRFESDEFDTIGGYVFGLFGRQPKPKDWVVHEGYKFTVEETDGRRISSLHVEYLSDEEPDLGVASEA